MNDLISRQAAIDAIYHHLPSVSRMEVRTMLHEVPSAQRWIPCSERLPELGEEVLVCYDFKGHRSVLIGCLYGDGKFHGYDDEYLTVDGRKHRKVVAWMPLPEPYKEEQEWVVEG